MAASLWIRNGKIALRLLRSPTSVFPTTTQWPCVNEDCPERCCSACNSPAESHPDEWDIDLGTLGWVAGTAGCAACSSINGVFTAVRNTSDPDRCCVWTTGDIGCSQVIYVYVNECAIRVHMRGCSASGLCGEINIVWNGTLNCGGTTTLDLQAGWFMSCCCAVVGGPPATITITAA